MRTLNEEIARVIRSRVVNPKWIDGVKRHGYKGASELAATVDYLFGYDATARVVSDHQYALVTDAYVNDADTREFMQRHNPHALHSICERLLEAMQRGLWQNARRLSRASRTASAAMPNSNSKANANLNDSRPLSPGVSLCRAGRPGAVAAGAAARRNRSRAGRRAGQRAARHGEIDGGARARRVAAGRATRHICRSARAKSSLIGTLDIESALRDGGVQFSPGLLAKAHQGVLYVDEVNLLPNPLVDAVARRRRRAA